MKQFLIAALLAAFFFHNGLAQSILSAGRRVDWGLAGYGGTTPVYRQVNMLYFGADASGSVSCNTALQDAINSLNGTAGTLYFPQGTYFFNQAVTLPSNVVLKGDGRSRTNLVFNLNGAYADLINISGSTAPLTTGLQAAATKGNTTVLVEDATGLAAGDYVRINQNDAALVTSAWALGSVGQLVQISSVNGNTIALKSPLRKSYSLADMPKLTKLNMITGSGLECLTIKRLDATTGQTSNIRFENAARCWVKNVESDSSNFAHINITTATNIEVANCYLHGAFGYGDGGQGYGVVLQGTSGECRIENNAFRHLRHSMILQSGANGNVLAYNYSTQTYWTDVSAALPADAAGDMVLHGNWPYANLFEGNYGQNIVMDNSHGVNGPFNTFFRNRAANYGVMMNTGAGDSINFIGNEITHTSNGLYMLTGNGNYTYGNNVKGVIMPLLTNSLSESSMFLSAAPAYYTASYDYPTFGPPNAITNSHTVPASSLAGANDCCCGGGTTVVLPIVMQRFSVATTGCLAQIKWQASDDEGDAYIIESSTNGRDFSAIHTVAAKGGTTTNYYSAAIAQKNDKTWYRLRMVNRDGTATYSAVVVANGHCNGQTDLVIAPNPVGSTMHLQLTAASSEIATVYVSDLLGKIVVKQLVPLNAGFNNIGVNVHALTPGLYNVWLSNKEGQITGTAQKLVKSSAAN